MANPLPQSKAREAFQRLAELSNKRRPIDELSLARFERAARDSMNVDPVNSSQLMGAIAAHRWNMESVQLHFSQAIESGGDHEVWSNYATALRFMNRTREAAPIAEHAIAMAPMNLTYLKDAISNRICLGDWKKARELIDVLSVRTADIGDDFREALDAFCLAERIGLNERTVGSCMDIALELLEKEKVRFDGVKQWTDELSDDGSIYLDLLIYASDEDAESLDDRLTPLLFDGVADLQLSIFGLTIKASPDGD